MAIDSSHREAVLPLFEPTFTQWYCTSEKFKSQALATTEDDTRASAYSVKRLMPVAHNGQKTNNLQIPRAGSGGTLSKDNARCHHKSTGRY